MPPSTGLRVLSLDGGGVRGLSSLLILASILKDVRDLDGEGSLDNILPCNYFDVITGTGIGGILAILLGRLKLTIPQCLAEYRQLSSRILDDGSPVSPLFKTSRLMEVAKETVERYSKDEPYLQSSKDTNTAKTFAFAVAKGDRTHCFRTYIRRGGTQQPSLDLEPSQTLICDAFGALLASPGLFDDYTIKSTTTSIKFADQPFPLGLQNPIIPALDEIRREFDDPIDFILSIGCGQVAENDIPDLLRLGCLPPQVQAMKISPFSLQFYSALARYPNSWLVPGLDALITMAGYPTKVVEKLKTAECLIEDELRQIGHWERYHRFDIGAVEDVGPSDVLSVREVDAETKKYLAHETLRIQQVASRLIKQSQSPSLALFESERLYDEIEPEEAASHEGLRTPSIPRADTGVHHSTSPLTISATTIIHINGWQDGVGSTPMTLLVVKVTLHSTENAISHVLGVTTELTFNDGDDSKEEKPTVIAYGPSNPTVSSEASLLAPEEEEGEGEGSPSEPRETHQESFFVTRNAGLLFSDIHRNPNSVRWYMKNTMRQGDDRSPEFTLAVLLQRAPATSSLDADFHFIVTRGDPRALGPPILRIHSSGRSKGSFTFAGEVQLSPDGEALMKAVVVDKDRLGRLKDGRQLDRFCAAVNAPSAHPPPIGKE